MPNKFSNNEDILGQSKKRFTFIKIIFLYNACVREHAVKYLIKYSFVPIQNIFVDTNIYVI